MPLRPCTNEEWETLPRTILTSDVDWDPTVLDFLAESNEEWFDAQTDTTEGPASQLFDEFGNYRKRTSINEQELYYFDANSSKENDADGII